MSPTAPAGPWPSSSPSCPRNVPNGRPAGTIFAIPMTPPGPARRPPPRGSAVPRHAAPPRFPFRTAVLVLVVLAAGAVAVKAAVGGGGDDKAAGGRSPSAPASGTHGGPSTGPSTSSPTGSGTTSRPPTPSGDGVVTPPPLNTKVPGLVTFRGNATRSYDGEGPLPKDPEDLWSYPSSGGLCSVSDGGQGPKTWCGTGWTGQPNVIPHKKGTIEIREGAYDGHYHFWNGETGEVMHPDLVTGDLAKGSASSDADGYPLYYAGSRDNYFRIVALDRSKPAVLWQVNADTSVSDPRWNNDWDGAALQRGVYLLEAARTRGST